jgi:hypothetical protein
MEARISRTAVVLLYRALALVVLDASLGRRGVSRAVRRALETVRSVEDTRAHIASKHLHNQS